MLLQDSTDNNRNDFRHFSRTQSFAALPKWETERMGKLTVYVFHCSV